MADSNKREKIAAAKRKLKQFQKTERARSVSRTREPADGRSLKEQGHEEKSSRAFSPEPALNEDSFARSANNADVNRGEADSNFRTTASTESLQQLSRQINGLLSESSYLNGDDSSNSGLQELEERNRDLAALLAKHSQANEQLLSQNQQLREHSTGLQQQLEAERNSFHEKHKKDIGSLKEQLQVHIQTIGILVAEKTELQSQVSQYQRIAEQRIEEIEELSGRLKASRQRVADLERSLSGSSQSVQHLEKTATESAKELEKLKLDLAKISKQNEELKQQNSELQEKLQSNTIENRSLRSSVEDLQKRLEMAELYAHQLSSENESSHGSVQVLTKLQKEKDILLDRLRQEERTRVRPKQQKTQDIKETVNHEELSQKLQLERDQVTEQYQHYTDQLRHQSHQLTQQITVLTEEREELLNRQHDLEGAVIELQKKLEDVGNVASTAASPAQASPSPELVQELENLRTSVKDAAGALDAQVRDNLQLSRLLEEKEERITSLERSLEELREQASDKTMLLESIQSDKTALSRALTQNKELKSQLAELQQGFVKMSNDNMELVTKLSTEQHSSNELTTKLTQQEDELLQLKEMLTKKVNEISELTRVTKSVEKEMYQQDQMKDRLRHYEAQAQLVDTLQNELTSAQDMMEALTTQNSELRTMLIKATEVKPVSSSGSNSEEKTSNPRDEIIKSLQDTIRQLEVERGQLYESLKEQRKLSDNLGIKIADLSEEVIRKTSDSQETDKISRAEYNELKAAMEMIQQKYMHVMKDKADLSDKADQLEHLVLQLQGETDTIGEYISLYHHQRALLQQRESQKNDYIAQLARDREQLQDKLGELQALVMQLLGERNMLHSYNVESRQSPQPQRQQQQQHQQHQQQQQQQQQQISNGPDNSYENDWPDYTSSESDTDSEVEPIVGGQQASVADDSELTPQPSPPASPRIRTSRSHDPFDKHSNHGSETYSQEDGEEAENHQSHPHHHHHHHHHHRHHHHNDQPFRPPPEGDKTAHKILTLLTELGHSHLVEQVPLIDRNFLPCKFCTGAVQIV